MVLCEKGELMPEYIVDCDELPYGDGMTLVLPVGISSHVHERIT